MSTGVNLETYTLWYFENVVRNPGLLSQSDWSDLQKIASNLPENIDEISQIIRDWLKQEGRDRIQTAFDECRKNIRSELELSERTLGPGGSISPISANQPSLFPVVCAIGGIISPTSANQPSQFSKELLENAIKRNSPLSDDTKTTQDTNTTQKS